MFLFFDVHQYQKQIEYNQTMTCLHCGHFGRYEVYVVANRFRLFFIPMFSFGKKYLVRATCCDTWYLLDMKKGKAIAKGEPVELVESDLELYRAGRSGTGLCPYCGKAHTTGANYCPNCGRELPQF